MRLLHTSDWHIGRSLHGAELLREQEAVLSRLAEVVAQERVDVVLVAGDVYDRAVPSADASAVLDRVLMRFRAAGAQVVLTPGNHDSARRLSFGSGLFAISGVHIRAVTAALDEPVLLADEHGEVAVYGLPYLEPEVARPEPGVGLWGGQPRGRAGRGHGAGPRRSVPATRGAVGGAGARLRRRRRGQRQRARHLRRRRGPGPGGGLRRGRLGR